MKKFFIFLLILSIFIMIPIHQVSADTGPRPTLEVEVVGIDKPFYIDILVLAEADQEKISEVRDAMESQGNYYGRIVPEALYFVRADDYVPMILTTKSPTYYRLTLENEHLFSLNVPQSFKILLLFEDGNYITSKLIEPSLFNSKIRVSMRNVDTMITQTDVGSIQEIFPIATMAFDLTLRILGTIVVEFLVLVLFGYFEKKSYMFVMYINLFTQVTLTLFMFVTKFYFSPIVGELIVLLIGEAFIFTFEILIYRKYLKEHGKSRAVLYGLIANTVSLLASFSIVILYINF
jgi:hypothetical protein